MSAARIRAACVVILLGGCHPALALNPAFDVSQYGHTAWRFREGFVSGRIAGMAQTPDGYLWLGTEFGLVRFDGVRTVLWRPPPGQQLPDNAIRGLLASRDGTLWIGTLRGLASWKDGRLIEYPELAGSYVDALAEDLEGTVWAVGSAFPNGRLCAIQTARVQCYGHDGNLGPAVESVYVDRRGSVWVGATTALWRWKPGSPQNYPASGPLTGPHQLAEDNTGALLIGTDDGVRQLMNGRIEEYPIPGISRQFKITALLRDRDGSLWIGHYGGLLHIHEGGTDTFSLSEGLSGDLVENLFEDREGNVWVVTHTGLDRFRDVSVATLSVRQGLSNNAVGAVLADRDGSVWIGTTDGLNRWSHGQITVPTTGGRTRDGRLGRLNTHAIFLDARGTMWISTAQGIGYLENGRFVSVSGVPAGIVRSMIEDRAGNLWIASQEAGLVRISPTKDVERVPWASVGRKDFALSLAADPARDGLWLGFYQGGIAYYADGQVRASYAAADGLGDGFVQQLRFDDDGALWAATQHGLSRVKNGRVSTLTRRNGLPCDAVHWSIEDDARALWLYMACGLVRVARPELNDWSAAADGRTDAKATIHTTLFDTADGVSTFAFGVGFSPQVAKSTDGRLWFVADGLSVVDPDKLIFNNLPPSVQIEEVTADGKPYEAGSGIAKPLRLPPLTRDLRIDYTALSFAVPDKNRFRYRLEGYDRDWQDAGSRRQAFYTNLPPGQYRFRVTAANNSGVWNETGASFNFSIAPAFYQTPWFLLLSVVMVLAAVWTTHRVRVRIVEKHEREISALNERLMKAQEQERIRISGELHDGVMQEMLAMTMMLGTAKRKVPGNSEAQATIDKIQDKMIRVGTDLRRLSHDLHPPILQEAGLPKAVQSYCDEFSATSGIAVSCEADERASELSRGAALALFRILQEALGNAAKHAAAKRIAVRLTRSNSSVTLSVSDDGVGFDRSLIDTSRGLGLITMRERASQLNGTFEYDSAPGRGTTIRVTIPLR